MSRELTAEEQEEYRTKLKKKTLEYLIAIQNLDVQLQLYDKTKAEGNFQGTDSDMEYLAIKDLRTPLYSYPTAKVRTSDILYCTFVHNVEQTPQNE